MLLAPIPKDDWSGCLKALLDRLPDRVFQYKPVLMVGSGGFIGEMQDLESSLAARFRASRRPCPLSSVHVGIKNWVFVGDRPPSLTAGTEARLANAIRRLCAETAERTRFSEAA